MSIAHDLTGRDIELIALLARGHTTDRVARELKLSRHTVGERISILLERFRCHNRTELVAYFYAHGVLAVGTWPPGVVTSLVGASNFGAQISDPVMHCSNGSLVLDPAQGRHITG